MSDPTSVPSTNAVRRLRGVGGTMVTVLEKSDADIAMSFIAASERQHARRAPLVATLFRPHPEPVST